MVVVAFLLQRIGPYHHARLNAWAALGVHAIHAIEFRPTDTVYAWAPVKDAGNYVRSQTRNAAELVGKLDQLRPDAVVCVGYADLEINQAMAWALKGKIPLVTCSDSTYVDEPRSWVKEMFKRQVLKAFDAALVAGRRSQDYLKSLGVDRERQFRPWDVVDNSYFEQGAQMSRAHEAALRAQLKLPRCYFLCVARFVPKKNLPLLIKAYARYAVGAGGEAWSLVLSGSGSEEAALRDCAVAEGVGERVFFPGFIQYGELPAYFALAGALVLPSSSDQWGLVVNEAMSAGLPVVVSNSCGCVPDLVKEGENGFSFDSSDEPKLAQCLTELARMEPERRAAMGRRSREIIAAYSPAAFSTGLAAAVSCALAHRRSRPSWVTRQIVGILARRTQTSA